MNKRELSNLVAEFAEAQVEAHAKVREGRDISGETTQKISIMKKITDAWEEKSLSQTEKLMHKLGNRFRGLWRSRPVTTTGEILSFKWYVTFEFRFEMHETEGDETPEEALESAIKILGKE